MEKKKRERERKKEKGERLFTPGNLNNNKKTTESYIPKVKEMSKGMV